LANGLRLRKIDEQSRPDHFRLSADDECYFLYEYTSQRNYSFSSTNNLISNLKKKPGAPGYQYKLSAIAQSALGLRNAINPKWFDGATLIPVPPSKVRGHPDYDDRITQVCQRIRSMPPLDLRELVVQRTSLPAAHESSGQRPSVEDLLAAYEIDETLAQPIPNRIGVVDDVLTAGTHFVAMKTILTARFPRNSISGFFIAPRVFPDPFVELPA
jgi:predicted amidophosphoribosyltransferase